MMRTITVTLFLVIPPLAGCQSMSESTDAIPALSALPEDAEQLTPREVGGRAPHVSVRNVDDSVLHTADLYCDGPVMLVFYRGGWCPFCTRHLSELAGIQNELRDLGVQLVGVSPDKPAKLQESLGEHEVTYTLLSDQDVELARAFGVAFRVDDDTNQMLHGYGINLEDASGRSHRVLPVPAVYLIDRSGVIRYAHWDANYRERLSADEVLAVAHRLVARK